MCSELGANLIELMPVATFPGTHGWGYDGVSLWAVHEPYGGPDGDAGRRVPLGARSGSVLAASADGVTAADALLHLPARCFAVVAV
jgi:hypothetical protein